MIQRLISLITTVLSMSTVTILLEYMLPAGRVKRTAALGIRLTFLAAVCEKIVGIFTGWGV